MKVMVIHFDNEAGKALSERIQSLGAEVQEQVGSWPGFYQAIHQPFTPGQFHRTDNDRPELIVVEGASKPSEAREIAGYLGETIFTRTFPVYLVGHPEDEHTRAQRRAPKTELITMGRLERMLMEKLAAES